MGLFTVCCLKKPKTVKSSPLFPAFVCALCCPNGKNYVSTLLSIKRWNTSSAKDCSMETVKKSMRSMMIYSTIPAATLRNRLLDSHRYVLWNFMRNSFDSPHAAAAGWSDFSLFLTGKKIVRNNARRKSRRTVGFDRNQRQKISSNLAMSI